MSTISIVYLLLLAKGVETQKSKTATLDNFKDSKDFDAVNRNRNQGYQIRKLTTQTTQTGRNYQI